MTEKGDISYGSNDAFFVIKLTGELRFMMAPKFRATLEQIQDKFSKKIIVLDLSELKYADSMILGVMMGFFVAEDKNNAMSNIKTRILCADDIKRIFHNIGFEQYFDFIDNSAPFEQVEMSETVHLTR